jgi:hypothetical protein
VSPTVLPAALGSVPAFNPDLRALAKLICNAEAHETGHQLVQEHVSSVMESA